MTRRGPVRTEPRLRRGQRVEVREDNLSPWTGVVTAVKWSGVSGWWVEVRPDEGANDGLSMVMVETMAVPA